MTKAVLCILKIDRKHNDLPTRKQKQWVSQKINPNQKELVTALITIVNISKSQKLIAFTYEIKTNWCRVRIRLTDLWNVVYLISTIDINLQICFIQIIYLNLFFPQDENLEEETEKSDDIKPEENLLVSKRTTLEERRKSLLDTHWAIPSRDR